MEVVSQRLATIYKRLLESDLVKTKSPTADNIEKFKKTLNLTVPVSEYDKVIGEFGRFFHKSHRFSFTKFLEASDLRHFILVTDGNSIVNQLGLNGIIMVKWNRNKDEFEVTVDDGSNRSNVRTERPLRNRSKEPTNPRSNVRNDRSKNTRTKIPPMSYQELTGIMSVLSTSSMKVDSNVKSYKDAVANTPPDSTESSPRAERKLSPPNTSSWADIEDDE